MSRRSQVEQTVRAVIGEILPDLPAADVTLDKNLRDLGADSVDRVEIISLLVHRLASKEPISSFADIPHIGALIDHLSKGSQ
ncbi:phosphopantetheine-binding protein [Streptomyces sp. NPDC005876]|jgi:polyketide biosynthesis acyl carrier protein|uniref:acyl carrier protein n=1 Tax=unclassified Streptomyces TaxID=2593676 RepID=UPI0033D8A414